jgi:hypothetical protein
LRTPEDQESQGDEYQEADDRFREAEDADNHEKENRA